MDILFTEEAFAIGMIALASLLTIRLVATIYGERWLRRETKKFKKDFEENFECPYTNATF